MANRAAKICRELLRGGTSREQIDVGVYFTDFGGERPVMKIREGTAGNGILEPQECYAQAIREAERDMLAYGQLLLLHKEEPTPDNRRKLVKFKKKIDRQGELGKFKREIPWLYTDFNPFTPEDDKIFAGVFKGIADELPSQDPPPSFETAMSFADKLVARLTAPVSNGGFGIQPIPPSSPEKPTINTREQTAIQTIHSRHGDCSEFGYVFYGLMLMSPFLVPRIIETASTNERYEHGFIAASYPARESVKMLIADPAGGEEGSVRGLGEGEWEISPLQLLADYANNMAIDPPEDMKGENRRFNYSRQMFSAALRYDPFNQQIHYNLGNLYFDAGEYDMAQNEYEETLRLDSHHANAQYNLRLVQKKQANL